MTRPHNYYYEAQTAHTPSNLHERLELLHAEKERWITYRNVCDLGSKNATRHIDTINEKELELMAALQGEEGKHNEQVG